jgi:protein-tyrosine phosphatase
MFIQPVDRYLEAQFGGRRPFLHFMRGLVLYRIGKYREFSDIDFPRVDRLIFVCQGNICRSPYAEAKSRQLINMPVMSAGLDTSVGCPADAGALKAGLARGVDLSEHRSMPLSLIDTRETDLLVAMEPVHAELIASRYPAINAQVTLLGLWCPIPTPFIQDPYGRCDLYFAKCFERLDCAVTKLVGCLQAARQSRA